MSFIVRSQQAGTLTLILQRGSVTLQTGRTFDLEPYCSRKFLRTDPTLNRWLGEGLLVKVFDSEEKIPEHPTKSAFPKSRGKVKSKKQEKPMIIDLSLIPDPSEVDQVDQLLDGDIGVDDVTFARELEDKSAPVEPEPKPAPIAPTAFAELDLEPEPKDEDPTPFEDLEPIDSPTDEQEDALSDADLEDEDPQPTPTDESPMGISLADLVGDSDEKHTKESLEAMKWQDIKKYAKDLGISTYKKKKVELIEEILEK